MDCEASNVKQKSSTSGRCDKGSFHVQEYQQNQNLGHGVLEPEGTLVITEFKPFIFSKEEIREVK